MSRDDAPNLRSIDLNSCESYKIICRKYNFTIVTAMDGKKKNEPRGCA